MAADVQRVLVALGLVLVLEPVAAEPTFVLLLGLVCAGADRYVSNCVRRKAKPNAAGVATVTRGVLLLWLYD